MYSWCSQQNWYWNYIVETTEQIFYISISWKGYPIEQVADYLLIKNCHDVSWIWKSWNIQLGMRTLASNHHFDYQLDVKWLPMYYAWRKQSETFWNIQRLIQLIKDPRMQLYTLHWIMKALWGTYQAIPVTSPICTSFKQSDTCTYIIIVQSIQSDNLKQVSHSLFSEENAGYYVYIIRSTCLVHMQHMTCTL